tara:strand:+ start:316 stop:1281 length:966 start_codon:yes stop_codon:yes gene_type:complete
MRKILTFSLIACLFACQNKSNNSFEQEKTYGKSYNKTEIKSKNQDCEEDCYKTVKNLQEWTTATYSGCVDKFDIPSGKGKQTSENNQYYDGCWKDGQKHGYGEERGSNYIYKGNYKDGWMNGYGEITYLNPNLTWNATYHGNWENGRRHGEGAYTDLEDNMTWIGEWKNGNKSKGRYIHQNYYNPDDIMMEGDKQTIQLDKHPQSGFCYIDVTFDNITESFRYDSGAHGILINPKLFGELKKSNINLEKINIKAQESYVANGNILVTEYYIVDELSIGNMKIKNVIIAVSTKQDCSLLFNLSKKFSNDSYSERSCEVTFSK